MKRLLLVFALLSVGGDLMAGYSVPSRGGFSGGRSYSAPSRSYSAPSRSYSVPARPAPAARPATAPTTVYHHTTVVQQSSRSGGMGGFWTGALIGGLLGRSTAPDPDGMICSGGGCSRRVCRPAIDPQVTP